MHIASLSIEGQYHTQGYRGRHLKVFHEQGTKNFSEDKFAIFTDNYGHDKQGNSGKEKEEQSNQETSSHS